MGLSAYLQEKSFLARLPLMSPEELLDEVLANADLWYSKNPSEVDVIRQNLSDFLLPCSREDVLKVQKNIALHYYEKLIPLCKGGPLAYSNFIEKNVDFSKALKTLEDVRKNGNGVLLATPHYGAVELIAPTVSHEKLPISAVLKFSTEELSQMAENQAKRFFDSGEFALISFIQIGKEGVRAAMDMASVIRRGEILLSVFDEKTEYSIPVNLLGKKVWGGAGLDKLIKFTGSSCAVFATFMIRTQNGYELQLKPISTESENPINDLYIELESVIKKTPEQWYFLHESIPFVDNEK